MRMLNLKNIFKTGLLLLSVAGIALVPGTQAAAEWGPQDRQTYTWANPASSITFNSITDNPVAGDERHFHTANQSGVANYTHSLPVTDGETVTLRTYFHNNASADLNLVATNTRVKMLLDKASTPTTDQTSVSHISADNAVPGDVWDTVHLTSAQPITLDYQEGSARLTNNIFPSASGGTALSDDVITNAGALVGYDALNGQVPGCNQFSGWVTIKVVVHVQQTQPPVYTCDALSIVADVNRTVKVSEFRTTATNGAVFKNADINWGDNTAPSTGLTNPVGQTHQYAQDGTYTITATAHFTVNGQDVTDSGPECVQQITIKTNVPPPVYTCDAFDISKKDEDRSVKVTKFETTAKDGATFKNVVVDWGDNTAPTTSTNIVGQTHQYGQDGTYTITATAHFTVNGQDVSDSGPECVKQVTFKAPPQTPVYTCDAFNIAADVNRTIKVTKFETTAKNGAVFKNAVVDWGDGSTPMTSDNIVGQTHQYAKDGTYTITATAHFTVDGKDVTATGPNCAQNVTFKNEQPPVVTPPPATPAPGKPVGPTQLVNTGAGSNFALFALVTSVATLAYRRMLARRLTD